MVTDNAPMYMLYSELFNLQRLNEELTRARDVAMARSIWGDGETTMPEYGQRTIHLTMGSDAIREFEAALKESYDKMGRQLHVVDQRPDPNTMYTIF